MSDLGMRALFMSALKDHFLNEIDDSLDVYIQHMSAILGKITTPSLLGILDSRLDPFKLINKNLFSVVRFDEMRFSSWLREASAFAESNLEHSDFAQIFSNGLNYNIVLADMLKIDRGLWFANQFVLEEFDEFVHSLHIQQEEDNKTFAILRQSNVDTSIISASLMSAKKRKEYLDALIKSKSGIEAAIKTEARSEKMAEQFVFLIRRDIVTCLTPALETVAHVIQNPTNIARRRKRNSNQGLETLSKDLERIIRDPSIKAAGGDVYFAVVKNKFSIQPLSNEKSGNIDQLEVYNSLKGVIDSIVSDGIIERITNHDKSLAQTLSAYAALLLTMPKDKDALNLLLTGQQIHNRLMVNKERPADEKIDPGHIKNLEFLLSIHGIFLTTLPSANNIIEAMEKSSNQFARFQAVAEEFGFDTLGALSRGTDIFDEATIDILSKTKSEKENLRHKKTKGLAALENGLIRGALRSVSMFVIDVIKKSALTTKRIFIENIVEEVSKDSMLFKNIVNFLNNNRSSLELLAQEFPSRFSWIANLIRLLFRAPDA